MKFLLWIAAIYAVVPSFVFLSCGPGVGEGPLPPSKLIDASVPDADASIFDSAAVYGFEAAVDAETGSDPEDGSYINNPPLDYCANTKKKSLPLVRAEQLSNHVNLVSMGENTLLAEETTNGINQPILVFLDADMYIRGQAKLSQLPAASAYPIGVVNRREAPFGAQWPFNDYALVLVRDEAGNSLYGANLPTETASALVLIPNSQIPADVELRAIVYLPSKMADVDDSVKYQPIFQRLCALGDGLYCLTFNGTSWQRDVFITPHSGGLLNSVAVWWAGEEWFLVGAGDGGRLVKVPLDSSAPAENIYSGTTDNLRTVSTYGGRLAAAGDNGATVFIDETVGEPVVCNLSDQAIVSFKWWSSNLRGLYKNGELFELRFGSCESCAADSLLGSALSGRLTPTGGFLVLNQKTLSLVTVVVESSVIE
jgi:hypothetical protein